FARVISLVFAPEGGALYGGTVGVDVHVWDIHDGSLRTTIRAVRDSICAIDLSPDGLTLAVSTNHWETVWVPGAAGGTRRGRSGGRCIVRGLRFVGPSRGRPGGDHGRLVLWTVDTLAAEARMVATSRSS